MNWRNKLSDLILLTIFTVLIVGTLRYMYLLNSIEVRYFISEYHVCEADSKISKIYEVTMNKLGYINKVEYSTDNVWHTLLGDYENDLNYLKVVFSLRYICKKRAYELLRRNQVLIELEK